MAKFLNTKKSVSEIEDLIRDAGQTLILISPYLKLSKDFKELLSYRNSKDKVTTVIFGKVQLNPDEMKFLESLRFVILKYKDDLHAKCYLNDDKMIITSLNLYEFSMNNNKEMGVLIEKSNENDKELFEEAYKEVDYNNTTSERFSYKTQSPPNQEILKDEKPKSEPKNESKPTITEKIKEYFKPNHLTTKELSELTGLSSRKINEWLSDNKLMYKKDEDWIATKKGTELGGISKEGQYGKFIVWPEKLAKEIR